MLTYISKVISGACPHCGKTKIFKSNGNPFLFKMPVMNKNCSNCGYEFHRETGFYFGAMYMSYGLTVAEMVAVFVLGAIFKISLLYQFITVVVLLLILSTFNYRIARVMWLNVFYKNEEKEE